LGNQKAMSSQQAANWLLWGKKQAYTKLWLGGGEPTLRSDLPALVRAAKKLGYKEILIQTNALRLAYPSYPQRLVELGVTEFRLNLKSCHADLTDHLSQSPGTFAHIEQALSNLQGIPVKLSGDVLLTRETVTHLQSTLEHYHQRGVVTFWLWWLSAWDNPAPHVAEQVPQIADSIQELTKSHAWAQTNDVELWSLHTPPCSLPENLRVIWKPAIDLELTVIDPGGSPFRLEQSPFEGGTKVAACSSCPAWGKCQGARNDYVAIHGESEFIGLPAPSKPRKTSEI
jgi:hypothetical protein